jgi:CRISPR system Cascade subunit CasA
VLYRALEGPTSVDQARSLFRSGLPTARIREYLAKWQERFWLYDDDHPFYQVPDYEPQVKGGTKQWKAWPALAAEHNAENAKTLFDHVELEAAGRVSSRKAARWLLACQTFVLGGGNSDFGYTKGAPSAVAVMVLPLGRDLGDTLLLSLVPENREVWVADRPIWEQEPIPVATLKKGAARPAMGIADLYTWRSRAIRLNLEGDGNLLGDVAFAAGVTCSSEGLVDPMLAYRIDPERGRLPVRFGERGLWRNFDALLPDGSGQAPLVINHAAALTRACPERAPRSVMVLGQANDKAKIEFWRMELFALPEALGGDREIREEVRRLLVQAEDTQRSLWEGCRSFARSVLAHGGRDPAPADIRAFVDRMPVIASYWSMLEARFHQVLRDYTLERDFTDIERGWVKSVRDAASQAWMQHRKAVSSDTAWTIRALVKAEALVARGLRDLNVRIAALMPEKEVA